MEQKQHIQEIFNRISAEKIVADMNILEKPLRRKKKMIVFAISLVVICTPLLLVAAIGAYLSDGSMRNTFSLITIAILIIYMVSMYVSGFKPIRKLIMAINDDYNKNSLETADVHITDIKKSEANRWFNLTPIKKGTVNEIMEIHTAEGQVFVCNNVPETTKPTNINVQIEYYSLSKIVKSIIVR